MLMSVVTSPSVNLKCVVLSQILMSVVTSPSVNLKCVVLSQILMSVVTSPSVNLKCVVLSQILMSVVTAPSVHVIWTPRIQDVDPHVLTQMVTSDAAVPRDMSSLPTPPLDAQVSFHVKLS